MTYCSLVLIEATNLENIDDGIATTHNTWYSRLGEQPFIVEQRGAFEMGLNLSLRSPLDDTVAKEQYAIAREILTRKLLETQRS